MNNLNSKNHHKGAAGGIKRLWNATCYSIDGLKEAFKKEAAFRQEVFLACVLIPLALYLPVPMLGKALMIGSVFLTLIVELINSAIEAAIDRVSLEKHPLAKHAKDLGSAAVLVSIINIAVVWAMVLLA